MCYIRKYNEDVCLQSQRVYINREEGRRGREKEREREGEGEEGRERERDKHSEDLSAKTQPPVLQRVQRGDAGCKHFVGLAETITTQINTPRGVFTGLRGASKVSVCFAFSL